MATLPPPDFGAISAGAPSGMDRLVAPEPQTRPIDRLKPESDLHAKVLERLKDRLEFSERAMSELYSRWNYNEQALQAYIKLDDRQERLKNFNQSGKTPEVIDIVVPYAYASLEATTTFLSSVLFGRRPLFQLEAVSGTLVEQAELMEAVLQYNCDHSRLVRHGFQMLWDTGCYGMGTFVIPYVNEYSRRTRIQNVMGQRIRAKEEVLSYSGNKPQALDPYRFFPDPRVPMSEVSEKGDFMFWRDFMSSLSLEEYRSAGVFKHIEKLPKQLPSMSAFNENGGESRRNARVGVPNLGLTRGPNGRQPVSVEEYYQIDQGVVKIIPSEWGLGDSDKVELWIFAMAQKERIIQAEPYDSDHGMLPSASSEPHSFGYEFGSLAAADFLVPFQETLSWLVNSRMHNVRAAVNNMFVIDPSRVEVQDIERAGPGKMIRMKKAFYGSDVRMAIHQLPITDVTQAHLQDLQVFQRIADQTLGVNDNLRGMMTSGGRKSATESRLSIEAGASRLSHKARLISADCLHGMVNQMILNIQQYMPDEMWINIVGADGISKQLQLAPEMLNGDFNYRVSDGSLPYDKGALAEVWKELFLGIAQDPELRRTYNLTQIFDYLAELGGARNLDRFKTQAPPPVGINVQAQSPEEIQRGVSSGQLAPLQYSPGTF